MFRALPIGLLAALLASAAPAQRCDDFDDCTANDMCCGGECIGSFHTSAGCDDGNACCTINDRCLDVPFQGHICQGIAAPLGKSSCSARRAGCAGRNPHDPPTF